jgi:hypothetical protein
MTTNDRVVTKEELENISKERDLTYRPTIPAFSWWDLGQPPSFSHLPSFEADTSKKNALQMR